MRHQLRKGASQIKIAAGGGTFTEFGPIDTLQFMPEEMRAAVQTASDWGTYVAAHLYGPAGTQRRSRPASSPSTMRRPRTGPPSGSSARRTRG